MSDDWDPRVPGEPGMNEHPWHYPLHWPLWAVSGRLSHDQTLILFGFVCGIAFMIGWSLP